MHWVGCGSPGDGDGELSNLKSRNNLLKNS